MTTDLLTPIATVTLFSDDMVTLNLVNGVRPTIVMFGVYTSTVFSPYRTKYQISTPVPVVFGFFQVSEADVEVVALMTRLVTSDGGAEIGKLVVQKPSLMKKGCILQMLQFAGAVNIFPFSKHS